jgi:hypothetical protein
MRDNFVTRTGQDIPEQSLRDVFNDVSKYIRNIFISFNAVLPKLPDNHDRRVGSWLHQLVCVVRKRSASYSITQLWVFLAPEWVVQVQRWSPIASSWNFLQPQVDRVFSVMTGIWVPMVMAKEVCQRLADQASSIRWGLVCPSQLTEEDTLGGILFLFLRLKVRTSWDLSLTLDPTLTCDWDDTQTSL